MRPFLHKTACNCGKPGIKGSSFPFSEMPEISPFGLIHVDKLLGPPGRVPRSDLRPFRARKAWVTKQSSIKQTSG
jgi:hypothetical protein